MKYYLTLNLKGTANINRTHFPHINRIDNYSDESDLGSYVPISGAISVRSFSNNVSIFNPSIGQDMLNFVTIYDRGIFCGGSYSAPSSATVHNNISYITISTCGNSEDFGELNVKRGYHSCTSNGNNNRALVIGGDYSDSSWFTAEYINILSRGSAVSYNPGFYNNSIKKRHWTISNTTMNIAVTGGSYDNNTTLPYEYCNISTLSSGSNFGSQYTPRWDIGGVSNGTLNRGIMIGGSNSSGLVNTSEYFNISSPSNALLFGDLALVQTNVRSVSNKERNMGCYAANKVGTVALNNIDCIRISFASDSLLFGYLTDEGKYAGSCDNGMGNRGIFLGLLGNTASVYDQIDFITISHWNSAYKFGNLWTSHYLAEGTSNA